MKQDKTEFLNKVENVTFDTQAEMPEKDAHEERARSAKANPLDPNLAEHEADSCGKRNRYDLLPDRGLCK